VTRTAGPPDRPAPKRRPGEWTCDDAEAARLEANQTARPRGPGGPTPEETWQAREALGKEERAAFAEAVRRFESAPRQEQGYAPDVALDRMSAAAVMRVALGRALLAHGLLVLR
jgi:hypothetical protein